MNAVYDVLKHSLSAVGYHDCHHIHLTQSLAVVAKKIGVSSSDYDADSADYEKKIEIANTIRQATDDDAILSRVAIANIRAIRLGHTSLTEEGLTRELESRPEHHPGPIQQAAYVIRQLKRPEELDLLRQIYGKNFIQISISLDKQSQITALDQRTRVSHPGLSPDRRERRVDQLIRKDRQQDDDPHGQRFSDAFHTGDVFLNGSSPESLRRGCNRFIRALFGSNMISPTVDEMGAYFARGASLRSVDLSRQVGAAILTDQGDVVAVGCNEVPRPGGGTYWCSDPHPARDIDQNFEPNKAETSRIIYDFVDAIRRAGFLDAGEAKGINKEDELVQFIVDSPKFQSEIRQARISDLTEFGRMCHAEMTALTDAARLGLSLKGTTIHVTTYPCHNCAKHLIAAGISRIVFIEPYPKSMALEFHQDALSVSPPHGEKVILEHFVGISPRRFEDVFSKKKRRDREGRIKLWDAGVPHARTRTFTGSYTIDESLVLRHAFAKADERKYTRNE